MGKCVSLVNVPFGLRNAPALFQRFMDTILSMVSVIEKPIIDYVVVTGET